MGGHLLSPATLSLGGYWPEFATIAVVHLLAVASPGPDFAVVFRESLVHGRRSAVVTSLGVGAGILVHVTYALLGVALLIAETPALFTALKYVGAAYLAWIGFKGLRATRAGKPDAQTRLVGSAPSGWQSFRLGFLTNALNPKATLFFLALFSVIIAASTPNPVRALYGGYMATATAAWFSLLSFLLGSRKVRELFANYSHWVERGMGLLLIALAIQLAWTTL